MGQATHDGYVPDDMNMGGDSYLEIDLCLDCGQVQGEWPLPLTLMESKQVRVAEFKKQKAVWAPPPRNPTYSDYLDQVKCVLQSEGHMGIYAVLPVILGEDENVDRICAGVQEVFRSPEHAVLADTILDQLNGWEHYKQLKSAVMLSIPPKLVADYDDLDEDDD